MAADFDNRPLATIRRKGQFGALDDVDRKCNHPRETRSQLEKMIFETIAGNRPQQGQTSALSRRDFRFRIGATIKDFYILVDPKKPRRGSRVVRPLGEGGS